VTRRRIWHGRAREEGFALPTALAVLVLLLIFSAIALTAGSSVSSTANRDARQKAAVAAAEAGVQTVMYRLNSLQQVLDFHQPPLPCIVNTAAASAGASVTPPTLQAQAGVTINDQAWCPVSGPEALGNGESFSYQLTPILAASADLDGVEATLDRKVVVTGHASGFTRRVRQDISAVDVSRLFKSFAAVAGNALNLNQNSHVGISGSPANVRSDGSIRVRDSSQVCGGATPGPNESVSFSGSGSVCSDYSTEPARYTLRVPSPSAEGSSNSPLDTLCLDACPPGISWNGSTRSLTVAAGGDLTLEAGTFLSLCQLSVQNGGTIVASATGAAAANTVRILMDSPSSCGGSSSLAVNGTGTIQNALADPAGVQIQSAGTGASMTFSNSPPAPLMRLTVLAPGATVNLARNTRITGGVAGSTVNLTNNASLSSSASLSSIVSPVLPVYRKGSFVECSPTAPSAQPDSGC
jgi:type II secretory pathway pseudopilin PulG